MQARSNQRPVLCTAKRPTSSFVARAVACLLASFSASCKSVMRCCSTAGFTSANWLTLDSRSDIFARAFSRSALVFSTRLQ